MIPLKVWYSNSLQAKPVKGKKQCRVYSAEDIDKKIREIKATLTDFIEREKEAMGCDYDEQRLFEHAANIRTYNWCLKLIDTI